MFDKNPTTRVVFLSKHLFCMFEKGLFLVHAIITGYEWSYLVMTLKRCQKGVFLGLTKGAQLHV